MDLKTLRTKTKEAVTRELSDAEGQLREMRFQIASHQLKQVRTVREVRRNIARLRQVLREMK